MNASNRPEAGTYALYAVEDRRCSGEWRTVAEYRDSQIANIVAARLRELGDHVRVQAIPAPIER